MRGGEASEVMGLDEGEASEGLTSGARTVRESLWALLRTYGGSGTRSRSGWGRWKGPGGFGRRGSGFGEGGGIVLFVVLPAVGAAPLDHDGSVGLAKTGQTPSELSADERVVRLRLG